MRGVAVGVLLVLLLALAPPADAQKQPIVVTSTSRLALDLPASAGVNTATPIRGTLYDSGDVPVPNANIVVRVNGVEVANVPTTPDGRFAYSRVFTSVGTYQITAEFGGNAAVQASQQTKTLQVVSAGFELPESANATRGGRLDLTGRVIVNGDPSPNVPVTLRLDAATHGPRSTGADGRFTFTLTFPPDYAPGVHFANYTATVMIPAGPRQVPFTITFQQLVHVRTNATIVADGGPFPEHAAAGSSLTRLFRLVDENGVVIRGIPLHAELSSGGPSVHGVAVPGPDGRASYDLHFPSTASGTFDFVVYLRDTSHVRVAENVSASIKVDRVAIAWIGGAPQVYRGETNQSFFAVTFGDERTTRWKPVGGDFALDEASQAFRFDVQAPLDAPIGTQRVRVTLDGINVMQELTWRVLSRPQIVVEKDAVRLGAESEVVFRVVDEAGKPVPGVNLAAALAATETDWKIEGSGTTDGEGRWRWSFTRDDIPQGPLALNASGEGLFFSAQSGATVLAQPVAGFWDVLPWIAGGVALVGAGGGAYWMLRRRKAPAPAPAPVEEAAVAAVAAKGRSPSLRVEIANAERNLPAVWGAGEPFALKVAATGLVEKVERPLTGRKLALRIDDATEFPRTIELGPGGEAVVDGLVGAEGAMRFRLVYEADDDFDRTELPYTVRLVDYRKEIAREFDGVVERATLLAPKIGKQSTPRELQWALEEQLPDTAGVLDEIASVVEHANYSTHDVGRAEWVRLVRARQGLEPHLPAGREADAPAPR